MLHRTPCGRRKLPISSSFGQKTMGEDATNQTTLVLGATGSIGSAICRRLILRGNRVLAAGRNLARLDQLSSELGCDTVNVDADDMTTIEHAVDRTAELYGRIDGVANCIGTILLKPAHSTSDDEWAQTLAANLTSAFVAVRAAAKRMRKEGGSIVLVSSAAARIGLPNHEAIAAAKAGIIGLTISAAASYASRGIRVNAVAPGLVKSNMTRRLWETEAAEENSIAMHAMGRLGEPDEVASAIEWCLNTEQTWVTGQVIGVDGGLSSVLPRTRTRG